MKPRPAASLVVAERIPRRLQERRSHRDRPERRSTDAEDDNIGESSAHAGGEINRLAMQRLVSGEREKPEVTRLASAYESRVRRDERGGGVRPVRRRDSASDHVAHHVRVIDAKRHLSRCER